MLDKVMAFKRPGHAAAVIAVAVVAASLVAALSASPGSARSDKQTSIAFIYKLPNPSQSTPTTYLGLTPK